MHQFLKFIFGIQLYMFRTVSLSIFMSLVLYTQRQVYVIQVMLTACQQAVSITCMTQTYCCVFTADVQRNCPKHVEFYCKNNLEKLMHLFGFIIKIYHDTRYSECQIQNFHAFEMWYLPFYYPRQLLMPTEGGEKLNVRQLVIDAVMDIQGLKEGQRIS